METSEIQAFCREKNVLLEASLAQIFLSFEDTNFFKFFLEKIKKISGKNFITKSLLEKNKVEIRKFIEEFCLKNNLEKQFFYPSFENFLEEERCNQINEVFSEEVEKPSLKILSSPIMSGKKVEVKDFVSYFRNRYNLFKDILEGEANLEDLVSINKISESKQKFSVIGMVYDKKVTKNKNLILEIEDLTGKMKVLINADKVELLEKGEDIALDSIIGFKGVGNKEILFVNEIFFPEANLAVRKKGFIEEQILFIGDIHYGSKNFLEKDFLAFINFLNNGSSEDFDVSKVKYVFIIGDLITGIGNYPGQEADLLIPNLEEQFKGIASLLAKIRKDIKIIISPGNHDCVRLMEPQPFLDEKYAWPLYELENVLLTSNPALLNVGETEVFEGFDVLTYHGFSFPYYANNIPSLMVEKTMNSPEKIMKYLLKNRHLAPSHSSTQYFPSEKDELAIKKIPDIFVSGHTHKSGASYFNNILVISSSSWEGKTAYQEKFGNEPDHCKVVAFNTKTREIKILDFESNPEENKIVGGKRND